MKTELYRGAPEGVYHPDNLRNFCRGMEHMEEVVIGHVEGTTLVNVFYSHRFDATLRQTTQLVEIGDENGLGETVLEEFSEHHSPRLSDFLKMGSEIGRLLLKK